MRIGLIDVDGHNFPNLPLMKLSAYHKSNGDDVEMYDLTNATIHYMSTGNNMYDIVYMSKVFSFTPDYDEFVFADKVIKGGSGYAISMVDGREVFDKSKDIDLPYEIEHIYPDYDLYGITDTAYGFLSRGCPRQCNFCVVKNKEGIRSTKVADLSEFYRGGQQKNIIICDPNILACPDWKDLLQQLIDSKAYIDINQGLDIRMMTEEKARMFKQMKVKEFHFAWDRIEDRDIVQPKFKMFKEITHINERKLIVYVLCGDRERKVLDSDLERIYWLRDNGYWPYIMLYDKEHIEKGHELRRLQRWVNNRSIFAKCKKFEDYKD